MVAYLTIWNYPLERSRVECIECKQLIVKDGPQVDCDGEDVQLFTVVAADGIYHKVSNIEVM